MMQGHLQFAALIGLASFGLCSAAGPPFPRLPALRTLAAQCLCLITTGKLGCYLDQMLVPSRLAVVNPPQQGCAILLRTPASIAIWDYRSEMASYDTLLSVMQGPARCTHQPSPGQFLSPQPSFP